MSPAASPEILHHTEWRTWLFIAYSDERWLYCQYSLHHFQRLGECTFWDWGWKGCSLLWAAVTTKNTRMSNGTDKTGMDQVSFAKWSGWLSNGTANSQTVCLPLLERNSSNCWGHDVTCLDIAHQRRSRGKLFVGRGESISRGGGGGVLIMIFGWGCLSRSWKTSPYFRPKNTIFHTLFQTWLSQCIPYLPDPVMCDNFGNSQ